MRNIALLVCLLAAASVAFAQTGDSLEIMGALPELPKKPAKPAPPGYAYNDYGFLITANQAYWRGMGSYHVKGFTENGKNGMKAQDGTVLIPAVYDDLHFQYGGFIVASKGGRFGVVNEANVAVIPFSYKRIELLYKPQAFQVPKGVPLEDLRLVATRDDGHVGLLNGKGEVVFPFRENRFVNVAYFYPGARTTHGYVTSDPPAYQSAMRQTALIYHMPRAMGVVSMDGQVLLPFAYTSIESYYGNSHPEWVYVSEENQLGIFDLRQRKWQVEPKFYGSIAPLHHLNIGEKPLFPTLFATQAETEPDQDGVTHIRAGVIDSTGRTVLPFEYMGFGLYFIHGGKPHIWAQKMSKWGVVDIDNKVVTPFEHPKVIQRFDLDQGPHFSLKDPSDQYFGLLSLEGNMVLPCKYKWLGDHNGKLIIFVNEQMKCGLVDNQGREVLPGTYTDIQPLRHGFFYINSDSKLGIVDPAGKVLVQPAYRGAYLDNMLPSFSRDFKARGIPEAEVVTVLTREDGASFAFLKNGKLVGLD